VVNGVIVLYRPCPFAPQQSGLIRNISEGVLQQKK
jgi:hypothetical protein